MPKGTNQKFKLYQMGDDSHLYRDATEKSGKFSIAGRQICEKMFLDNKILLK